MPKQTITEEVMDLEDELLSLHDENEVEENADIEVEEYYPVEYSISSYGADYPVDGLIKRVDAGSIYIPKFQRSYVWNIYRASRFIESLLLGLPVPAIFLSRETNSNKMLVIDGQQRLRTLQYFYNGVFEPSNQAFKLKQVQARFQGRGYKTLADEDRLRLDDSIIHAIIVKQENPSESPLEGAGRSSIYHIFERLNTGGVLLQPQEIRSCIFHGPLIELLHGLNSDPNWKALFGKTSSRMRDRELILRFLALFYDSSAYTKPMKEFLNGFALKHRYVDERMAAEFTDRFKQTVAVIKSAIGDHAFRVRTAVNAALCDSVMFGVAKRLALGPISRPELMRTRYDTLRANTEFTEAISAGTTAEANVKFRLDLSNATFSDVP
jgi:Protein of unknown function DUF262